MHNYAAFDNKAKAVRRILGVILASPLREPLKEIKYKKGTIEKRGCPYLRLIRVSK